MPVWKRQAIQGMPWPAVAGRHRGRELSSGNTHRRVIRQLAVFIVNQLFVKTSYMPRVSRRFFDSAPSSWQELEVMVAQAFEEMGYETYRNHEVATVRGHVRIDVHALKKTTPIPTIVLCECKHWAKAVEQSVVYAFRAICSDTGAHFGLIISKVGFQSGANETRQATNIHLLNFIEFQETFFDEWKSGVFMRFVKMSDTLLPLVPFNPRFAKDTGLQSKLGGINVFDKYSVFFGERSYTSYFIGTGAYPVTLTDPRGNPHDRALITIESPRQYYQIAAQACEDARAYLGI